MSRSGPPVNQPGYQPQCKPEEEHYLSHSASISPSLAQNWGSQTLVFLFFVGVCFGQFNNGSPPVTINTIKEAAFCQDNSLSANTITCATVTAFPGYLTGQSVDVLLANTISGATTININTLGSVAVTYNGTNALSSAIGWVAGATGRLTFDGTRYVLEGLVNTSSGNVTSVGFTGGLISVANPTTTPAFTVAGTSGGVPYFSGASTWASSAAGTIGHVMLWGGAGNAPTDGGSPLGSPTHSFTCNIGSATGSTVITTGDTGCYSDGGSFTGTINRADIIGNAAALATCSITVDVWLASGAYPTASDKISASAPATLSSAKTNYNFTRTGWSNTVPSNPTWGASVATVTGCVYAQVRVEFQ